MMDKVIVRLKSPSGAVRKMPSESLNKAMVSLADSDEMRPLRCEASSEGRAIAIDIVQDRTGRPIFAHLSKASLD